MKYRAYIASGVLLLAASCSKETAQTEHVQQLPVVTVDVAQSREVPQTATYSATVQAENVNNIAPISPNRIKTISVEVGDHVRAGQLLVTMDGANADQVRINMEQLEREYNRAVRLLEIGSGTQQAVDQLRAQLDAARSQYNNIIENTELRSPITGVVTARNFDPGDFSGGQPILSVGQLTPDVKIMLNVNENHISQVRAGIPVDLTFDAYPNEEFHGTVRRVYPTVDPATRTFEVEVAVNNTSERLRPGMFARVNLNLGNAPHIVVPDRAVVKQIGSGNKYVYVVKGNTVDYRRVELGRRLDDAYEILSGLNEGDTVVITGQTRLADGVEIEILD